MTGFSTATRAVIREREGGCCARCGASLLIDGGHLHHRRPRKMGGSHRDDTRVSAALHLCGLCHTLVEANREWARVFGYLIPEWPEDIDPALVPVYYRGMWVLLDDDGNINPANQQSGSPDGSANRPPRSGG